MSDLSGVDEADPYLNMVKQQARARAQANNEPRGLYDLGLDREVYMVLRRAGVETLQELLDIMLYSVDAMAVPGIGPKRFAHIERTLQRWGRGPRKETGNEHERSKNNSGETLPLVG